MKRHLFILVGLMAWLNSCHKKCTTVVFASIAITHDISADSIAHIISYATGNNFTTPIDSATLTITQYKTPPSGIINYDLSDASKNYIVRLLPSGETHMISKIHYGDEKNVSGCGGGSATICSYGATVDGKDFSEASHQEDGNVSSGVILVIP